MKLTTYVIGGLVITCLVLLIFLQGSEEKASKFEMEAATYKRIAENKEKTIKSLEKAALEKVQSDKEIKDFSDDLGSKIDEATKQLKPEEKTVRATSLAIDCARMRRSKQTNTPKYQSLCL